MAGALLSGLPEDSRIMREASGRSVSFETLLLSVIADRLGLLVWMQTKDAKNGTNKPESIYEALTKPKVKAELRHFESIEEFKELYYGG